MSEQVNPKINYSYKLIKGGDGNLYVSIQPLMQDIAHSIAQMQQMDTAELNQEEQRIFELKIAGLVTVYEFLGGFVTEQTLKDKAAELKGNVALNTGDSYSPMGDGFNVTKH
jgi:hypothetical protein